MNKGTVVALSLGAGALYLWMRNSQGSAGAVTLDQIAALLGGKAPTGGGGTGAGAGPGGGADAPKTPIKTLADQLRSAAGVDLGNADEWNYFLERIAGRQPVTGDVFTRAFFPDGRPEGEAPRFSADDFVSKAKEAGGTGLDGFKRVRRAPLVIDIGRVPL